MLGAGYIARMHVLAASRNRRAKVVHIADIRLDAARGLAEEYGIDCVSDNPASVLADKAVDTVIVALPTFLHYEWIVRCAKAGKDVLTEKPLCRTVHEGRKAVGACAKHGVRLAVGFQRRFSPARIKVRELVRAGKLGRPITWTISSFSPRHDFLDLRGPTGKWLWDFKNGGFIMDVSIHDFDFACWVLGKPVEMFAQSRRISTAAESPTQASAQIRFEHGDNMVYGVAWQEGDFGSASAPVSIIGPKGTIILNTDQAFTWYYAPGKKKNLCWDYENLRPYYPDKNWEWRIYKQLDRFIRDRKPDNRLTTGEEALASLWLAEKILAAGPKGRRFRYGGARENMRAGVGANR